MPIRHAEARTWRAPHWTTLWATAKPKRCFEQRMQEDAHNYVEQNGSRFGAGRFQVLWNTTSTSARLNQIKLAFGAEQRHHQHILKIGELWPRNSQQLGLLHVDCDKESSTRKHLIIITQCRNVVTRNA